MTLLVMDVFKQPLGKILILHFLSHGRFCTAKDKYHWQIVGKRKNTKLKEICDAYGKQIGKRVNIIVSLRVPTTTFAHKTNQ